MNLFDIMYKTFCFQFNLKTSPCTQVIHTSLFIIQKFNSVFLFKIVMYH